MCFPNAVTMSSKESYMYMDIIILSPGSSQVRDLAVSRFNSTALNISFTTPSDPNGIIYHYTVHVNNALRSPPNFTVTVDNSSSTTDQYFTVPTGLGK